MVSLLTNIQNFDYVTAVDRTAPYLNCDGDEYYRYESTSNEYLVCYYSRVCMVQLKLVFKNKNETLVMRVWYNLSKYSMPAWK